MEDKYIELDEYDKKLLFELDSNARQSYTQLAKKIHLSKDTIRYKLNNYIKNGFVGGFYALIDSSKLGMYSVRVYFNLKEIKEGEEKAIVAELMKEKRVFYLSEMEGEYCFGFGLFVKTLFEFQQFWKRFKTKFPRKVASKQIDLFISLQHFNRNYFVKEQKKQIGRQIINEPRKENIDEINLKILNLLADDARISIVAIAQKVNLTSKSVILRIKNMEKRGVILGYKTKLNIDKIGISLYKTDIMVTDSSKLDLIKRQIEYLPNVIHTEETFGGADFEFDVECYNYAEFNSIILGIKNQVGEHITSINHYRTIKIHKTLYLPKDLTF